MQVILCHHWICFFSMVIIFLFLCMFFVLFYFFFWKEHLEVWCAVSLYQSLPCLLTDILLWLRIHLICTFLSPPPKNTFRIRSSVTSYSVLSYSSAYLLVLWYGRLTIQQVLWCNWICFIWTYIMTLKLSSRHSDESMIFWLWCMLITWHNPVFFP